MSITSDEAKQIVKLISQVYSEHLDKYNFKKYPADDYARFKTSYSQCVIPNNEIHNSLVWKWGHVGKANFPQKQKDLIKKVENLWPEFVGSDHRHTSYRTFEWWKTKLPPTSFITIAYITHLVHHAEPIPIIDQHNFRAMNHFRKQVLPAHTSNNLPRTWSHISELKSFMIEILNNFPDKSFDELDRFLMMYGRSIKLRKQRKNRKPLK